MIYTLTLNPSIDYVISLEHLTLGEVNRLDSETKLPGGKGINVSRILNRLNIPNTAVGYLGGFTGKFIADELAQENISTHFINVDGDTRINVKIKADTETEINGQGPIISKEQQETLLNYLRSTLTEDDVVVLAGSMPKSLPDNFYQTIIDIIKEKHANFAIDTTGQALLNNLPNKPLIVKPNHHELAEMFDTKFNSLEDIFPYGQKLLQQGAQYALVSMAGDGALFFNGDDIYLAKPLKGTVKNSVGAGDSMIAGFVGTIIEQNDPLKAFAMGVACGTATAFSTDLADLETINHYLEQVAIEKLN